LHKSGESGNFAVDLKKRGMKSLRSLFMQRCFFLVFLFIFLLVCNGFTLDKDYQSSEEKQEIDQLQEASNMGKREIIASICAISLFVISTVTTIFSIIAVRKQHAVERKNRVLADQIAHAMYYKTQYIKLQSEKEMMPSDGEISTETLSPEELFTYMNQIIQAELLFLQINFGRQQLMDRFHLSKERVGQAFAQGSSYNSVAEYTRDLRLEYSTNLLIMHPELSISDVSKASGFLSLSVYIRSFRNKYGVTPSAYRAQQ